jgi:hypothetical protein
MSLPEKQKQADLNWLIKFQAGFNKVLTTSEWVKGHATDVRIAVT